MNNIFVLLFLVLIYVPTNAQQNPFVRVYNLQGMKFNSGRVFAATDSSLQLKARRGEVIDLPIKTIGAIKIGRTAGQNIWIGALSGGIITAIIVASSPRDDNEPGSAPGLTFSRGESAVIIGTLFGLPVGAAAGGITALFKKSNTFIIDGRSNQWKEFQSFIEAKKELTKHE